VGVRAAAADAIGSAQGRPLTLAPIFRRTLSLIYEALLLAAVLWGGGLLYALIEQRITSMHIRAFYQAYLLLVAGIYFAWQWRHGQTLPMKTWRMRLVTRYGHSVTMRQAFLRYVVASAGLLLFGLGFLWALLDPERQFLHDRLAGTRIVNT
jgi:uncharacterized RDD family membrane protein YckC